MYEPELQKKKYVLTIKGIGEFVHVTNNQTMELLTRPNGADKHDYNNTQGSSDDNGGYSMMCQVKQFIHPVA